jgi:hypothetical protein
LRVDEDGVGGERGVDVVQGVHDALDWDTSQRPAAESEVESFPRDVERFGVVDGEAHAMTLLACQRRPRGCDVLAARVEGIHKRCAVGGECCQSPFAAADFEHALAPERNERVDRRRLDPVLVAPLHSLERRLVGLEGGTAGTELLRFAPGVLEGGAGVGVDELSGLDALEAVSF